MEKWKLVEEHLECSSYGRVRYKGKLMKQYSTNGYFVVTVKSKLKYVHRLVAQAFIDNPNKHPIVNHIDSNRRNNAPENLEWTTQKDNVNKAIENGNWTKNIRAVWKLDLDGNKIAQFRSCRKAGADIGVDSSLISRCCKGRTKRVKNNKYMYV